MLRPRRHRPPGRASVTSAKKLSESLRRLRRRCFHRRQTSPNRRATTHARTSSPGSRHYCRVAIVTLPAELSAHEKKTSRGQKIRTKCHAGSAVSVNWPGYLVTRPEKTPTNSRRSIMLRLGLVAYDICPVALCHSGGSKISGGDMSGRPCHLGRVALVFTPPESTSRAGKPQRLAEISEERPR